MTLSSAPGLTPPCAPPLLSVEFHHAPPPASAPATEADLSKPDTTDTLPLSSASPSALSSGPVATGLMSPEQERRVHRRVARAPRSGSCGHLMGRRAGGRAGGASARICLSRGLERAPREDLRGRC